MNNYGFNSTGGQQNNGYYPERPPENKKRGCITYLLIGLSISVLWNVVVHGLLGFKMISWWQALLIYLGIEFILDLRDRINRR